MGCDIHLHTEIKLDGQWHHYSHPDIDRNYRLFGKLAGVRGSAIPVAPPRGLPDDITAITRLSASMWENDGHSHSWIGAAEIADLQAWIGSQSSASVDDQWTIYGIGFLFGNSFGGFTYYPDRSPSGLEDVRFVFWFDN